MATITDSDSSTALDAEVYHPPYPFWLAVVNLTAQSVLGPDGTPLTGTFILTPSQPTYVPGWTVIEGSANLYVKNGAAAAPVVLVCTDAVTPGFTYTITQRLTTPDVVGPSPITGVAIPHTLGMTVDISTVL